MVNQSAHGGFISPRLVLAKGLVGLPLFGGGLASRGRYVRHGMVGTPLHDGTWFAGPYAPSLQPSKPVVHFVPPGLGTSPGHWLDVLTTRQPVAYLPDGDLPRAHSVDMVSVGKLAVPEGRPLFMLRGVFRGSSTGATWLWQLQIPCYSESCAIRYRVSASKRPSGSSRTKKASTLQAALLAD